MKYFLGIGNPGEKFYKTNHSLGLIFINFLINKFSDSLISKQSKLNADIYTYSSFKLIYSKVYMNHSIDSLVDIYNVENLFVAHDELMIPKYSLKIKTTQGNSGHNGLRSISSVFNNYSRIQIGIDHPKNFEPNIMVKDYVLAKIDNLEKYFENFENFINNNMELFI